MNKTKQIINKNNNRKLPKQTALLFSERQITYLGMFPVKGSGKATRKNEVAG